METKTSLNERAAGGPRSERQHSVRRDGVRRAPAAKGNSVEFDPKLLWVTFRRCWMWATPVGLALAATAAYAVYATFVPTYQARHLLEANKDHVVFRGVMPTSGNLAATEKQLIFTDLVLDVVLSDPEVQAMSGFADLENAKHQLREKLSIGNAGSKELLTVSYEHSDPAAAALICNKVTEAYLAQRTRFDNERVSNLESWLSPSIDLWKAEVQTHEKRVRDLSRASLGYDPTVRVEGVENDLTILSSLRRDLANMIVEESILEAKVAMHDSAASIAPDPASLPEIKIPEPTTAEIQRFVDVDHDVVQARRLLADREAKVRAMEDRGLAEIKREYYRGLQSKVTDQVAVVERAEQAARDRAPGVLQLHAKELAERKRAAQLAQAVINAKTQREAQRAQLAELKAKRAILQQEYDVEKARLEQQGGNAADLRFAQEDREIAVGILTQLNHRLAAIRTEQRRGPGVHTLAAATVPTRPVEPMPTKKMLVAGAGAFAIPFLLGLLWEFRSQRISDAGTLESKDLAPIVGEVARLPSKITAGSRGRRVFEESIDTLRANLMLSKETRGVRSIAVASSMSGEGKSSVASQLAISLAKACGKTVLLVDCDLRSPDQHDIFGLPMGPGLTKVLAGEATLEEAVDTSLGDLVHVLPAGQMLMSPHRLLNASALRDTLDQAMHKYAYVVVDTAPVLAAGETLAVASETDATLLCVMRDVSRSDTVVRSNRRLEAAGANVVGTVFSGVPYHQYAYRYGDYRYLAPAEEV